MKEKKKKEGQKRRGNSEIYELDRGRQRLMGDDDIMGGLELNALSDGEEELR